MSRPKPAGKHEATIYVNRNSRATSEITDFIAKHGDEIFSVVTVKVVTVNESNMRVLLDRGINKTPTMFLGGQVFIGTADIIRALTPARRHVDRAGLGSIDPEEELQRERYREMANKEEQEPEPRELRDNEIRQKMEAMQKRRPVMVGPGIERPIPGGKPIRSSSAAPAKYDSDAAFIEASRIDNIQTTPTAGGFSEVDGLAALEQLRNDEADAYGRTHKKTGWRRPAV